MPVLWKLSHSVNQQCPTDLTETAYYWLLAGGICHYNCYMFIASSFNIMTASSK